jgi:hypothetical protein
MKSIHLLKRPLKPMSISRWLEENKGGKWKYDNHATWWCDDDERHVSRVAKDFSDDSGTGPVGYYLYGGASPGWVYFYQP